MTDTTHNFDRFQDTNALNRFAGTLVTFDTNHVLHLYDSAYVNHCNNTHGAKLKSYRTSDLVIGKPSDRIKIETVSFKEKTVGMFLGVDDYVLNSNSPWEPKDFIMFMVLKFLVEEKVVAWNILDIGLVEGLKYHIKDQQTFDYRMECSKFPFWWSNRDYSSDADADTVSFFRYLGHLGFHVSDIKDGGSL